MSKISSIGCKEGDVIYNSLFVFGFLPGTIFLLETEKPTGAAAVAFGFCLWHLFHVATKFWSGRSVGKDGRGDPKGL
jgi:hypothetical protein